MLLKPKDLVQNPTHSGYRPDGERCTDIIRGYYCCVTLLTTDWNSGGVLCTACELPTVTPASYSL